MIDPEKFALLSSYLDGEVSPQERAQVEEWLRSDPQMASCYRQQLRLQQMWRVPVNNTISATSVSATWEYIQRRQQQRWLTRTLAVLGMCLLAGGGVFVSQRYSWQQAQEEPLILALEQPLLPMPKELLQD
ncbi:MAG: hypothetical protein RMK91_10390 [Pseudanabaenaceae cyanobacterium SKYGB_i_bin29]|nr:hypothetical protein [Pseudanabaenaceae cyanobacterium SKYG29]MDW8422260.1 hypothetical protein [Pseudanabaenaceae cyanobacterium SKYGB_i_bin29]